MDKKTIIARVRSGLYNILRRKIVCSFERQASKTAPISSFFWWWSCQAACVQHSNRPVIGIGGVRDGLYHGPALPQLVSQREEDALHMVGHRVVLGAGLEQRHASVIRPALRCACGYHLITLIALIAVNTPCTKSPNTRRVKPHSTLKESVVMTVSRVDTVDRLSLSSTRRPRPRGRLC